MAAAILIALSGSGSTAVEPENSRTVQSVLPTTKTVREHCPGVRKALRFYTKRWQHWTSLKNGGRTDIRRDPGRGNHRQVAPCPRYLLGVRKVKAFAAHREWNRFFTYHYVWSKWLPANWRALAVCETGLNFEHSNSSFTSAFGISWAQYNADAAYMGAPPWHVRHTPRDQYKAALGHLARFGDGWSCPGP